MSGLALWDCENAISAGDGISGGSIVTEGRIGKCMTAANSTGLFAWWNMFVGLPRPPVVRLGFAVKFVGNIASGTNGLFHCNAQGSASNVPRPFINGDGTVTIKRSSTVLASSVKAFELDKWYYVEFLSQPHPSAGRTVFRVDGEDWVEFTGNTGAAPTGVMSNGPISFTAPAAGSVFLDDIYCLIDGATNDWLGDISVVGLPSETAVSNTGWTGGLPWKSTEAGQVVELSLGDLAPELTGQPLGFTATIAAKNSGGTTLGVRMSCSGETTESTIGTTDSYLGVFTLTPGNPNDLTLRLESL